MIKFKIALAFVSVLMVLGFFIYPRLFSKNIGASVIFIEGEVEYQHQSNGWKTASLNSSLSTGDSLRTLGNSVAIVNLDDGSSFRLAPNSSTTLTSLNPQKIVITNNKGQVYNRVTKLSRQYIVTAGSISYQSLGTVYNVINTTEKNGVEVFQSQVKVIALNQDPIVVDQGNKFDTVQKVQPLTAEELKNADISDYNITPTIAPTPTPTIIPTSAPTAIPTKAPGIYLRGSSSSKGLSFSWTVAGLDISQGFKLVKSSEVNPVYPGNDYQYLSESSTRQYTWSIKDGRTYYFRLCQYQDGKCLVYSNNLKLTAPEEESSSDSGSVKSISVSASGSNISWSVNGYSASGFKIVWSKNGSPTYPTREGDKYHYLSEPSTRSDSIDAFSGSGHYYVRVCEYLGGRCGVYSNQVEVNL